MSLFRNIGKRAERFKQRVEEAADETYECEDCGAEHHAAYEECPDCEGGPVTSIDA